MRTRCAFHSTVCQGDRVAERPAPQPIFFRIRASVSGVREVDSLE